MTKSQTRRGKTDRRLVRKDRRLRETDIEHKKSRSQTSSLFIGRSEQQILDLLSDRFFEASNPLSLAVSEEPDWKTFDVIFCEAFDDLDSPIAISRVRAAVFQMLVNVPFRRAKEKREDVLEIVLIARHVGGVETALFLTNLVKKYINQPSYTDLWNICGDLIFEAILDSVSNDSVYFNLLQIYADSKFNRFVPIVFFGLWERRVEDIPLLVRRILEVQGTLPAEDRAGIQLRVAESLTHFEIAVIINKLDQDEAYGFARKFLLTNPARPISFLPVLDDKPSYREMFDPTELAALDDESAEGVSEPTFGIGIAPNPNALVPVIGRGHVPNKMVLITNGEAIALAQRNQGREQPEAVRERIREFLGGAEPAKETTE